jgi:hypothetical protein
VCVFELAYERAVLYTILGTGVDQKRVCVSVYVYVFVYVYGHT